MLARYTIVRGAPASTLPAGVRQDTRKHTRHVLRPTPEMVEAALGGGITWEKFERDYTNLLQQRYREQRDAFDALAHLAKTQKVWLGCNCPTAKQPDVKRCHTAIALRFMQQMYPELEIAHP